MTTLSFWGIPAVYFFIVIAIILPRIPVVGKFFNIINTGLHELGHALMALLMQGKVHKIELLSDTSGTTVTQTPTNFGNILVSLSGYTFAAAMGCFCCYLNHVGYQKGLIILLSVIFLFMLALWVRNVYGLIWIILFCGLNAWLLYDGKALYVNMAALFYSVVIIMEAVSSSFILLALSIKDSGKAGDATNLTKFTHVPAFLWSLLFVSFSLWMAYLSARLLDLLPLAIGN